MPDPRAPLDPQVKVLFDMMGANRAQRVLEPGPMREGLGALGPLLSAGAPAVGREQEIRIPGPAGALRARVFSPSEKASGSLPVIVFFHGGGYVVMSPETHEKLTKQLCVGVGAIVVSVDFELNQKVARLRHKLPRGWRQSSPNLCAQRPTASKTRGKATAR